MNEYENNSNGPQPTGSKSIEGSYEIPQSPYYGYTDEALMKLAKKRVQERNGLIIHIVVYLAVNIFLFFVALADGGFWNFYVTGGWGVGLACHMASYFLHTGPEAVHAEYIKLKSAKYK